MLNVQLRVEATSDPTLARSSIKSGVVKVCRLQLAGGRPLAEFVGLFLNEDSDKLRTDDWDAFYRGITHFRIVQIIRSRIGLRSSVPARVLSCITRVVRLIAGKCVGIREALQQIGWTLEEDAAYPHAEIKPSEPLAKTGSNMASTC